MTEIATFLLACVGTGYLVGNLIIFFWWLFSRIVERAMDKMIHAERVERQRVEQALGKALIEIRRLKKAAD